MLINLFWSTADLRSANYGQERNRIVKCVLTTSLFSQNALTPDSKKMYQTFTPERIAAFKMVCYTAFNSNEKTASAVRVKWGCSS